jgi:WD40 repeat protein
VWFTGHEGAVLSIAWSNSGKFVLSGSADHTGRLWAVDGDTETQVRADSEAICWPHFTRPHFSHIRTSHGCGVTQLSVVRHALDVLGVAWSVDDKLIATASADGTIQVGPVAHACVNPYLLHMVRQAALIKPPLTPFRTALLATP